MDETTREQTPRGPNRRANDEILADLLKVTGMVGEMIKERQEVVDKMARKVDRIHDALYVGNGRPGLMTEVEVLKRDMQAIKATVPVPTSTSVWINGIILALGVAVAAWAVWFAAHPVKP